MAETQLPRGRGLALCVSGPSGVGKGTVIRKVMDLQPGIVHSVSVTTRPPRSGEKEGVDYYFRTLDQFRSLQAAGEILESDLYCGHYYGTPRSALDNLLGQGYDVLLDVTVSGSLSVMASYPNAVTLFLLPPSFSELQRRLERRGTENGEAISKRLLQARAEISQARLFQYLVVNDDLTAAARKMLAIITAEHCRTQRQTSLEETILAR